MSEKIRQSILHEMKAGLDQFAKNTSDKTSGLRAIQGLINDLSADIGREIDQAPAVVTIRREIAVLLSDQNTAITNINPQVAEFNFSAEGMAEAVSLSRDINSIDATTFAIIECRGSDSTWRIPVEEVQFLIHLAKGNIRHFAAHVAEYLAEREPA